MRKKRKKRKKEKNQKKYQKTQKHKKPTTNNQQQQPTTTKNNTYPLQNSAISFICPITSFKHTSRILSSISKISKTESTEL